MILYIFPVLIFIGIGYWIYVSIPPLNDDGKQPIEDGIDWESLNIDRNDLTKRREYVDQLYEKVKADHIRNYGSR